MAWRCCVFTPDAELANSGVIVIYLFALIDLLGFDVTVPTGYPKSKKILAAT